MKQPFEAVAIRYVHDARVGEFLNIGVVVWSPAASFAGVRFLQGWRRVSAAFPGADLPLLRRIAQAFERRAAEWQSQVGAQLQLGPRAGVEALVREVVQLDDSSLQLSPVISGLTADAQRTLVELFELYVSGGRQDEPRRTRDDADVWRTVAQHLVDPALVRRVGKPVVVRSAHLEQRFEQSWQNGRLNVAQALSLDQLEARSIREKALLWRAKIETLNPAAQDLGVVLVLGLPNAESSAEVRTAALDGLAILTESLQSQAEVITEADAERLARRIAAEVAQHAAPEGEQQE